MAKICCPCCGEFTREKDKPSGFCPVCGWIYDDFQENNPKSRKGKNARSLEENQQIFFAHRKDRSLY